ncbi:hypothetical protein [Clostridium botulinum]|uniref:Uncharacterized protein n=1 Tax=Clostridium botulinum B2 450 TaxID=1379739 RepID=A0A0D0ZRX8_CLOBO|nr:hypothetical protein [Clostridium botulinum]KIS21593.1 hypothetical protein N495_19500 [Clostridium botulinum B2 450]
MLTNKVFIERLYEGSTIDCKSEIDDIVDAIIEEYHANEICIGEVIGSLCIHGASIEDVAIIYAKVYSKIEEDKVIRITDSDEVNLAEDYD